MCQHEPQAITFIEVLPVHVDALINKQRKVKAKENERTRQPEKVWQYKTKRIQAISVYQEGISE